jgi:hypothetical protein
MMANGNSTSGYDVERAICLGRSVLGCLLEEPQLWKVASSLDESHFVLADHRKVFSAISFLNQNGYAVDVPSVLAQLGEKVQPGDVTSLTDGVVPANLKSYIRQLRESSRDRQFQQLREQLAGDLTLEDRLALLERMRGVLENEGDDDWRSLFHTYQEFENASPLAFAINGFLQEAGVTLIGGLAGHGKTLIMLAMVRALLEQSPLFGHGPFTVPCRARRILYLTPESSLGPFQSRLQLFRLYEHVRADRLLVRTLSCREQISLSDPRLLKAAEGADVFLDTAVRFMDGSENDVESARPFADSLFRLLNAGSRSITGAHHSPKGFEGQDHMTLENILRGSGDLGAMLCTCWGVRQIDPVRNRLYVQNVKPRDFQPCAPFILEGRPHLDGAGRFLMTHRPGDAGELSQHLPRHKGGGRPATSGRTEKLASAVAMRADGVSLREIEKKINVPKSTLGKWLLEHDASQKRPTVGQFRDNADPDGETPN